MEEKVEEEVEEEVEGENRSITTSENYFYYARTKYASVMDEDNW